MLKYLLEMTRLQPKFSSKLELAQLEAFLHLLKLISYGSHLELC